MVTSKYTIREQNEANILNKIINEKEISRAMLSVKTGLNKASVSSITKKLIDDDLVVESREGEATTSGGRKPIILQFNGQSALVISVDIGNNYIETALSYINGQQINNVKQKPVKVNAETVLSLINETIHSLLLKKPDTYHDVVGMTIAVHGPVLNNKILFTPHYDLDKIDLYDELSKLYPFPIFIENEANLAALGEYTFSSKQQNLVSISIHSGIGAGIVESGVLKIGKHGTAGEIGHAILFPDGRECPCGNHGCIEQYVSNRVIHKEFAEEKGLDSANSEIIADYYYKKDAQTLKMLEEYCFYLAVGISNIVTTYDPEVVIINSSLYREIPELLASIKDHLSGRFSKNVEIVNSTLEKGATLYGATAKSAQNFLNIKKLKLIQ